MVIDYFLPHQFLCSRVRKDAADNCIRLPIEYDSAQVKYDIQQRHSHYVQVSFTQQKNPAPCPHASVEMQRLHLAGQGVAAPAEELRGFLAVAVRLAHRDTDQGLLELGQGALQQRSLAGT